MEHVLKSPWVSQLVRSRPVYMLETDLVADICIIGGGVSGIMSAYQILKNTDRSVVVIEAHEIGHGATGHNAGQLVSELERSVQSLVQEYGLERTSDLLLSIDSAWNILEETIREAGLYIPYSTFEGYDVYATKKQVHDQLVDISLMYQAGLTPKKMYISEEHIHTLDIPSIYAPYYEVIPHASILSLSQTIDTNYIAAYPHKKGCLNSAVLVEQLAVYLAQTYSIDRFKIYEKTHISSIHLDRNVAAIGTTYGKTIAADLVMLCTNGFENFTIHDLDNKIDHTFHKNVKGVVGYMLAQTEEINQTPSAFMYCDAGFDVLRPDLEKRHIDPSKDIAYGGDYVYTTRRPYDIGHEEPKNLFCIGGKATIIEDSSVYNKTHEYNPDVKAEYEDFITKTFEYKEPEPNHKKFMWHGLMGYTSNGLRMVGFEKKNKTLMYNLGCNGVGLLPAVWSSKRVVALLTGDTSPSLFDPQ
jgi:glycine/D-amino acid oxidase-like deaminating enzyme